MFTRDFFWSDQFGVPFWCTENGRFMYSQIGPYRKLPFSVHRWRETTETIGVGGSAEAPFSGGFRPQRALAELPADVAGMELANSPCSCRSAVHCGKCTKHQIVITQQTFYAAP